MRPTSITCAFVLLVLASCIADVHAALMIFDTGAPRPPPEIVCSLKPDTGMGRAYFERYFFNATSSDCEVG